jgi:hypothetical protein
MWPVFRFFLSYMHFLLALTNQMMEGDDTGVAETCPAVRLNPGRFEFSDNSQLNVQRAWIPNNIK